MTAPFDPTTLPRKRVGAGVLLRNRTGEVLLAETTYKEFWEIPGGLVENGESPREAATRECVEELGIELDLGIPACIHYAEGAGTPGDGIMFVFDAGIIDRDADDFTLPPDELRSVKFVDPSDFADYLHSIMVTRMLAAIEGADASRTVYLER